MYRLPWYKRVKRWGQTNLTEIDTQQCDISFWKEYWKKNRTQGIVVNAGGIVAYYPSELPMQYRAEGLGDRDLLGEFVTAAREMNIAVLARMDINRATKDFYDMHPDWFVVDKNGVPKITEGRYFSCVNSDYYKVYIPQVLREIIDKYHPDGFTDNSWKGVARDTICYCENCRTKFFDAYGMELPQGADWNDIAYRNWINWSYESRLNIWDLYNDVVSKYGGKDCMWLGMVNANPVNASHAFCDLYRVGKRSEYMMCDHQSRDELNGFEQNALNGDLLHGVMGYDNILAESMANYVRGGRVFRRGSNPKEETRKWMVSGIAGGVSPWFHHIGSLQEDRRQYATPAPVMQWHEDNERYLYDRQPIADIGVLWSRENIDFYGRDNAKELVEMPWRGVTAALSQSGRLFLPINANQIPVDCSEIKTLILPNLAVISDDTADSIDQFVASGGSLVMFGEVGIMDEAGNRRQEFPLSSACGLKLSTEVKGSLKTSTSSWENYELHTYIRPTKKEHGVLDGFEDADIIPFGGQLQLLDSTGDFECIATYVPQFPIYPPEFSWMRQAVTDVSTMLVYEGKAGNRIVYSPMDIDRCYGRTRLPDHGNLINNAVRWAMRDKFTLSVEGKGYVMLKLYSQADKLLLHAVNLTGCNINPGYLTEHISCGKQCIRIKSGKKYTNAGLQVAGVDVPVTYENGELSFTLDDVPDHELVVLT